MCLTQHNDLKEGQGTHKLSSPYSRLALIQVHYISHMLIIIQPQPSFKTSPYSSTNPLTPHYRITYDLFSVKNRKKSFLTTKYHPFLSVVLKIIPYKVRKISVAIRTQVMMSVSLPNCQLNDYQHHGHQFNYYCSLLLKQVN